jgi:16S rRNA (uracil1498-N3)-methyltransferase
MSSQARFILSPEALQHSPVILSGSDAHHCQTLRLQVNEHVLVSDGQKKEYAARIIRFVKHGVELELLEETQRNPESPLAIVLYQGFARGSKLDLIIQKTTELGVSRIVPVVSQYSQMKHKAEREHRLDRWQEISRQAVRQSGRTQLPEIEAPCSFVDSLKQKEKTGVGILFSTASPENENWESRLRVLEPQNVVSLWVGPEGGFSEQEVYLAREQGLHTIGLGPRVLRSETAGITAVTLAQFVWGDLGGQKA